MNKSLQLQNPEQIVPGELALIIPMRPDIREKNQVMAITKAKAPKLKKGLPLFYSKPIFKTKKYDLL